MTLEPYQQQWVIQDRVFWIYFVIAAFFTIVGGTFIISTVDPNMIMLFVAWVLGNVALLIVVYYAVTVMKHAVGAGVGTCCASYSGQGLGSVGSGEEKPTNPAIPGIFCRNPCAEVYFAGQPSVSILFIFLLLLSVFWASALGDAAGSDAATSPKYNSFVVVPGILILVGGIVLVNMAAAYCLPFWVGVGYLLVWVGLTLYAVLQY